MDEEVMPLPRPLMTPPVTITYFMMGNRRSNMLKHRCGVDNPTLGELLYMLSSMVLFMEDGGLYHDRHTAMLSTDHMRNVGSKAEYANITKGNAKARCKALYLKCGVW
jgi:hypothetical protein